jgi:peptide deformylase
VKVAPAHVFSRHVEHDREASLTRRTVPNPVLRLVCEPVDAFDRRLRVVNPRLHPCDASREEGIEGCLSLPGVEVPIARARAIVVTGRTPDGKAVRFLAEGLLARVVQHEIDHLNGRLICDYDSAAGELGGTGT